MSLYGGIKFTAPELAQEQEASGPSSSASTPATATSTPNTKTAQNTSISTTTAKSSAPTTAANAISGEWSAALKFAPRIPKSRPTGGTVPRPSTSASIPVSTSSEVSVGLVRSAEPVLVQVQEKEDEIQFGPDGLPLAKAPAMIIETAGAGKKGWGNKRDRGGGDGQKKKKKKKRKNQQPLMPTFDPEEQYDPNRPNDLGEYQQYRQRLREEKRQKLLDEKRRKAQGLAERDSDESSYYTDSSEDVAPRRDAPKMFAPPKMYDTPSSSQSQPIRPSQSFAPPAQAAPISGDEAYARRAALASAASGDDAYARRLAMSQSQPVAAAASGDEAYARRLVMSQAQALPPFPPTGFAPPPPPPPAFAAAAPPPTTNTALSDIPGFGTFSTPAAAPPPSLPIQPASTLSVDNPADDFAKMLEERKKAAEAIAAKFRALTGGAPTAGPSVAAASASVPPSADVEEDSGGGTFAEKMMRKWGHKEGSGLGANGTGIVHALTAEHVIQTKPIDPNQPLSKRQLAKQKAALANAKNRKWVQAPNARGKIVNANEDERRKEDKGRFGEEDRIICLVGLVDGVEDVDEDLSDEIGEECSKFGIVERVVLHMVEPPPPEPSECLRVFIVFSGMAGAWRATKELDGRFFGGKKIRATYFDETKFDAGDRDGPLM